MAKVKLKITKTDSTVYEIDKFNGLKSIESLSQSTPDANSIYYGALSNSGSAEIVDVSGEIETLIKNGDIESSNVPVDIYLNGNLIQKHLTRDSDYTTDKILKLSLLDDIENYSNIECKFAQSNITSSMTLFSIITQCFSQVGLVDGTDYYLYNTIFEKNGTEISVYDYLRKFTVSTPYFLDYSFRHILEVVCQTAQLLCCKDNQGRLIFVNANPRTNTSLSGYAPNVVRIPKYLQITQPETSLFVKEKITNVAYQKRKIQNSIAQVVDSYYVLRDSDNNVSNEQLGDNSEILTVGSSVYACFFIKFNSDEDNLNYFNISDNTIDEYEFEWYNNDGELIGAGGSGYIIYTSNSTIADFNFATEMASISLMRLSKYDSLTSAVFAVKVPVVSTNDYKVRVMIRSQNYRVIDKDLEKYNSDAKYYTLPQNELINLGTTYNSELSIYDFLAKNLMLYYGNGVKTLKISIFASDLYSYNTSNVAIKRVDYSGNGEIISLDQNVIIDKDNNRHSAFKDGNGNDIVWRVVGRKFRYEGQPLLDLELQAVEDKGLPSWEDVFTYQGLDSNGATTSDANSIVAYRVTGMTDLLDSNVPVPNSYNGLPITQISGIRNFENKTQIKTITLPNSITKILAGTFNGCTNLESINIPSGVTEIGDNAFYQCTSLQSITLPSSLTSFGEGVFTYCSSLQQIDLSMLISIPKSTCYGCTALSSVTISNQVTMIGRESFYECTSLTSFDTPSTVRYFGFNAFKKCTSLTDIYIRSSNTYSRLDFENSPYESPFYECSSSLKLHIPSSVSTPANTYGTYFNNYSYSGKLSYVKDL